MRARLILWLALAALVGGAAACASAPPKPAQVRAGPTPDAPHVIILQSTNTRLFQAPVAAFMQQIDAAITLYDDVGADRRSLVRELRARKPDMIFTLGTKATRLAVEEFTEVPVLFTMVVNYRRLPLEGRDNVMGIALESSTVSEFSQFKMVLPALRKVLAFYIRDQSEQVVAEVREELEKLGVELQAVAVQSAAEVETKFAEHASSVDGVWLLNEPALMSKATFEFLRIRCDRDKLPLFASFSDEFARLGALMSVSTDLSSLGSQAASMARQTLQQGLAPAKSGVQPPISTKLTVNMAVARALGIELLDDSLPFIDELLNESQLAQP